MTLVVEAENILEAHLLAVSSSGCARTSRQPYEWLYTGLSPEAELHTERLKERTIG
jgi:hypothetical protein